jgi:hypothetical protein
MEHRDRHLCEPVDYPTRNGPKGNQSEIKPVFILSKYPLCHQGDKAKGMISVEISGE